MDVRSTLNVDIGLAGNVYVDFSAINCNSLIFFTGVDSIGGQPGHVSPN